jgi:glutaredoxin
MPATVYTKNFCPYCDMAKQLLREKGVSYTEININHSDNPQAILDEIQSFTKQKTFPQILLDDQYIGGYTDLRDFYYKND